MKVMGDHPFISKGVLHVFFVRTLANSMRVMRDISITNSIARHTPGLKNLVTYKKLNKALKEGDREAKAKLQLSWLYLTGILVGTTAGWITDGGPDDPDEFRVWSQTNKPYHFQVPGMEEWPYSHLGANGQWIGFVADSYLGTMRNLSSMKPRDVQERQTNLIRGWFKTILNNVVGRHWAWGATKDMNAILTRGQFTQWSDATIRMHMQRSVSQFATRGDEFERVVHKGSFLKHSADVAISQIPGLREEILPIARNIIGEPRAREGDSLTRMIAPGSLEAKTDDPDVKALVDWNLGISVLPWSYQRPGTREVMRLTRAEYALADRIRGELIRSRIKGFRHITEVDDARNRWEAIQRDASTHAFNQIITNRDGTRQGE